MELFIGLMVHQDYFIGSELSQSSFNRRKREIPKTHLASDNQAATVGLSHTCMEPDFNPQR